MLNTLFVKLENLKKIYNKIEVVGGINTHIDAGEVVCLLGVNGAGKTTTINMMLGLEKPTSGNVLLFGGNPKDPKNRRKLGMTAQDTEFPEGLTVKEILNLVSAHFTNPYNMDEICKKFDIKPVMHQFASQLSGGQKQRVALALAFIGNPKIVFLDEPTTGLDVESRQIIWRFIKQFIKSGGTLFLTTHYLEEAEALATRILLLEQGKIKYEGSVNDFKALAGTKKIKFNATKQNLKLSSAKKIILSDDQYTIETDNTDSLIKELVKDNVDFKNLEIIDISLESAFINMLKDTQP